LVFEKKPNTLKNPDLHNLPSIKPNCQPCDSDILMVAVIWLPEMSELDDVTTRVHAWYICCEKRERLLFRIRMTQLSSTYIAKSRYQKSSKFSVENLNKWKHNGKRTDQDKERQKLSRCHTQLSWWTRYQLFSPKKSDQMWPESLF